MLKGDGASKRHSYFLRDTRHFRGWKGHLWQQRFHCFVMGERHLLAGVR
jgi:putative transposase